MSTDINFTQSELEQLREGHNISGSIRNTSDGSEVRTKQTLRSCDESTPASSGWGGEPIPRLTEMRNKVSHVSVRNADGTVNTQGKVSRANPHVHNRAHEERALADEARRAESLEQTKELQGVTDPKRLHDTINCLDRKQRKLEKTIASLTKQLDELKGAES